MGEPLLEMDKVTIRFGGLTAASEFSIRLDAQGLTGLIGPNGAGKTTVFNLITGVYQATGGRITFAGRDTVGLAPHRLARLGIARTFQNIRLFPAMSVLENLIVAQHNMLMRASGYTVLGLFGSKVYRKAEKEAVELARYWLDRIGLTDRADSNAGNLAYGAQRRLEIARAMCTRPVMLCLDEPAAGLNPRESGELTRLLMSIRDDEGIGVLLIEHHMDVVMGISDHVVVLDYGRKISDGSPQAVRDDPAVIRAYLGEEEEEDLPPEVARDLGDRGA